MHFELSFLLKPYALTFVLLHIHSIADAVWDAVGRNKEDQHNYYMFKLPTYNTYSSFDATGVNFTFIKVQQPLGV